MKDGKSPYTPSGSEADGEREFFTGRILRRRFELLDEIGRGGLSRVFRARDLVAEQAGLAKPFVALKFIKTSAASDRDIIALMHREARRLRNLVQPNIVRVYDMDVEDHIHFLVMEHLEGQTLARALGSAEGHRLAPAQVDRIVADVCAGLHFAHARNVVHADLNPGNIFITHSGQIKLIDFNMACPTAWRRKKDEDEEDTIEILGRLGGVTPAYASPQRLAGAAPCESDDIFSLGVLIFLALTGVRPFGSLNALEAKEKGHMAAIPDALPVGQRMALSRALALDDEERIGSIPAFVSAYRESSLYARFSWRASRLFSRAIQ